MPTVGGLISGIDTNSIVSQLMDAARGPIRGFQGRISTLETRKSKLQEMNTLLSDFKAALDMVNGSNELPAYGVTSSQEDQLGATATGEALPGTYDVRAYYQADATIRRSQGFSSPTQQLRRGTMKINTASGTINVPMQDANGTRTIQGISDYINDNVDGVSAYVLDTGVGGSPFKLMLQGQETGAQNQFTTSFSYQGGPGTKLKMYTQQNARDAQLLVDGQTVYTPSNQAADIIPGITLDIKSATSGTAKISVSSDAGAMATNVQGVVDAYNKLNEFFGKNIGIDADPSIQGDQTIRTVQRRVQQVMSSGFGSGNIAGLNTLGLGTSQDGTLNFDTADFTSAVGSDFDDVMDVLTDGGLFDELYKAVDNVIDPATGILSPRLTSIDSQIDSLNDSILDSQYRLDKMEARLRQQFTAMEKIMAKYQATGDFLAAQIASLTSS
ncbi:MAG: flagellar filament capping protein FliD [Proteobacteria bacterium]|nr:flagellar filament capping protein FliD [Pseudomonadota bacterium]